MELVFAFLRNDFFVSTLNQPEFDLNIHNKKLTLSELWDKFRLKPIQVINNEKAG